MAFSGRTRTTVSLVWRAASDNVGVTGYRLFKNGRAVATATGLRHIYRGLRCGTRYTFALEAYDAAGNASYRPEAVGSISTVRCAIATTKPAPRPKPKPTPVVPAKPGLAHLWVDPNGGSCRRSAPAKAYNDAGACPSLAAAYGRAAGEDTIVVLGGAYEGQTLPKGTKRVTIRNAPGTRPVFRGIGVHASNVTLVGLHVDGQRTKSLGIYVEGDHNTFRNGSVHGIVDDKGVLNGGSFTVFDNYEFYDVFITNENVHNECVYSNGPNLTIRKSRFRNCAVMDVFITRGSWWNQPLYGGVTIEDNWFGAPRFENGRCCMYYSLAINSGIMQELRDFTVRNNYFEASPSGYDVPKVGTNVFCGNTGKAPGSWKPPCR
jgi:hypothetical protein